MSQARRSRTASGANSGHLAERWRDRLTWESQELRGAGMITWSLSGGRELLSGPVPSPPHVFDGAIGAARLVEGIESPHILVGQLEAEDVGVFLDAVAVGGLGDDGDIALDAPPQQDLCGSSLHTIRHQPDGLVAKVPARSQRFRRPVTS